MLVSLQKSRIYLLGQRMMLNHMKIKIQPCYKNYRYLEHTLNQHNYHEQG